MKTLYEKAHFGDVCDFCLGCVHHCKTHTLTINDEANPIDADNFYSIMQIALGNLQIKKI